MTTKNQVTAIWEDGYTEVARLLMILGFRGIDAGPRGVSAIVPDPADLLEEADRLEEALGELGIVELVLAQYRPSSKEARLILPCTLDDERLGPIEYALIKFPPRAPGEPEAPDFEVLETAPRFAPSEVGKATYKLNPDEYDLIPVRPRTASAA